jgi:hypothetical protein
MAIGAVARMRAAGGRAARVVGAHRGGWSDPVIIAMGEVAAAGEIGLHADDAMAAHAIGLRAGMLRRTGVPGRTGMIAAAAVAAAAPVVLARRAAAIAIMVLRAGRGGDQRGGRGERGKQGKAHLNHLLDAGTIPAPSWIGCARGAVSRS